MGFTHTKFSIPQDVHIEYCPKGNIENDSLPKVVLFPLMAVLEGGVRFPVDSFLLRTLSFYELSLDQCLPNFYRVVNSLRLTYHDINFMYGCCGSLKNGYYLKILDLVVRLISCLLNSKGILWGIS